MSDQAELKCVSCDETFDPAPTGGFCPDCDTPHPDFEHGEAEGEAQAAAGAANDAEDEESDVADDDSAPVSAGASPSYCQECGAEIVANAASSAAATVECSSCGGTVAESASYCPDCGAEVEAGEEAEESEDSGTEPAAETDASDADAVDAETEMVTSTAKTPEPTSGDAVPDEITLVVNGERYTFEDGDTFGRKDEVWLEDLVVAGGGADELSYISSEHVEFSIEEDGVYVTDISRNGTLLNATELDGGTEKVSDGDFLTLAGRAEVEIEL